jgi:hypothetical protein
LDTTGAQTSSTQLASRLEPLRERVNVVSDGKTWWAGTGLNRRHQDFQISSSIACTVSIFNDLLDRRQAIDVAPSSCQLHAVARRE